MGPRPPTNGSSGDLYLTIYRTACYSVEKFERPLIYCTGGAYLGTLAGHHSRVSCSECCDVLSSCSWTDRTDQLSRTLKMNFNALNAKRALTILRGLPLGARVTWRPVHWIS